MEELNTDNLTDLKSFFNIPLLQQAFIFVQAESKNRDSAQRARFSKTK